MALAYTDSLIRYETVAVEPLADFIAALDAILVDVGWEKISAYENGWLYQLASPQELTARCRIWNPAVDATYTKPHFALQFLSAVDPLKVGHVHRFFAGWAPLFGGDTREFTHYNVWANQCSLFIGAVHPESRDNQPKAVQGGIPYAYGATEQTPECGAENPPPAEATNELWWSAGDDEGTYRQFPAGPTAALSFRSCYYAMRYSFCHNGAVTNFDTENPTLPVEANLLQLGILKASYYWTGQTYTWAEGFVYPDLLPLASEPYLIHNARIYGELYDAVLLTKPMALDTNESIYESEFLRTTDWVNYSYHSGIFISTFRERDEAECSSLLLLTGTEGGGVVEVLNVAH